MDDLNKLGLKFIKTICGMEKVSRKRQKTIKVPDFNIKNGYETTKQRSVHMSKIRGKNTKPEIKLRKALYNNGIRFRVAAKSLPGKPDISNISKRFVVFVDGEFWHGYNWEEKKKMIKSNRGFWIPKIERNMQRDEEVTVELEEMGFKVFRFWADEVNKDLDSCVGEVLQYLEGSQRL